MQSGNSIWKLTALAGCVGLGLLGLMQFQRQMAPKETAKTDQKVRIEDFKPLEDLEDKSSRSLSNEPPEGNSEPRHLSLNSRRPEPDDLDSLDSAFDDLPPRKTSTPKSSRQSASRASFDAFDEDISLDQSEPTSVPLANRSPRASLSLEEDLSAELTADAPEMVERNAEPAELPAFDEDPKPIPVPQNAKKQAQELLKSARRLIDYGELEEARLKAAEAAELPATFGPLEDSPEAVLAEIERLTSKTEPRVNDAPDFSANEPIKLTGRSREGHGVTLDIERLTSKTEPRANDALDLSVNEPIKLTGGSREGRGVTLDLDEPNFDEKPIQTLPKKKSPLDDEDNLFADSPPKTINGKTRTPDLPVPPAEDDPLDFPPLPEDTDMPPAEPIKARHKTDDSISPNRLKATNAAPLDSQDNAESIAGDGTVRADSPRGPQRPELKIEKIAPPNATLNQPMVYTIVIRNVGDSAANSVVVEDQIPMGTKLSGTIPRAILEGKKLKWQLGTIKPGDVKEIQVKVVPVAEGQVGSIATVNFTAEVASRTTIASPKISLKLTATPQVRVNETVTLNFVVTNNGSVDAHRVVLRNLIPENLKLPDVAERDLEYDMGTIPAGKSQTVPLPLTAVRPGKVTNRAVITVDGASAAEQQIEINVIGQIVSLSRHGQTNWFVGRPVEFENRITNNSLNPTNNTIVTESLPNTVEFVSASEGGRFDAKNRTVTWHVPHLDPNQTLSLKIKVVPKSIGNHAGSVQVSENNRKGAATDYQFRAIGSSDLKVEFSEKAEAYSKGEQFTTRMVIRNKGSGAASNVAVRVTLPAELQFVNVRGPASHTTSGREIIFEPIREIGGQGNVHFDLTLKAIGSGDSKLQVELQSDQFKKPLTHEEALVIFGGN